MKRGVLLGLVGSLVVVACVSVNAVRLGNAPIRPPIPAEEVVIYRTEAQVPGEYEEVALLSAKGEAGWTDESDMFQAMRVKAGKLGANAIVLEGIKEPSAATKIVGEILGTGAERKGRAVAIFVLPEDTQTP
jgi:hypothetical protein